MFKRNFEGAQFRAWTLTLRHPVRQPLSGREAAKLPSSKRWGFSADEGDKFRAKSFGNPSPIATQAANPKLTGPETLKKLGPEGSKRPKTLSLNHRPHWGFPLGVRTWG